MTRKRLVKLLMGCGCPRNVAQWNADRALRHFKSYADFWRIAKPWFNFRKKFFEFRRAFLEALEL